MVRGQWPACDMRRQRGVFPGELGCQRRAPGRLGRRGSCSGAWRWQRPQGRDLRRLDSRHCWDQKECGEGSMGGPLGVRVLPEREAGGPPHRGRVVSCSEEGESRQPEKPGRGQRKPRGPSHATWWHPQPAWCPVLLRSQGLGRGDVRCTG